MRGAPAHSNDEIATSHLADTLSTNIPTVKLMTHPMSRFGSSCRLVKNVDVFWISWK